MIKGMHGMFFTPQAEEARLFLRDKLGFPAHDVGEGWLIMDVPTADVGCHPADKPSHSVSFYCDDLSGTIQALKERGVEFEGEVQDQGWGHVIVMKMPGGVTCDLYEPRYQKGS